MKIFATQFSDENYKHKLCNDIKPTDVILSLIRYVN